jgi:hypothetical protein
MTAADAVTGTDWPQEVTFAPEDTMISKLTMPFPDCSAWSSVAESGMGIENSGLVIVSLATVSASIWCGTPLELTSIGTSTWAYTVAELAGRAGTDPVSVTTAGAADAEGVGLEAAVGDESGVGAAVEVAVGVGLEAGLDAMASGPHWAAAPSRSRDDAAAPTASVARRPKRDESTLRFVLT